jgi:hypothetical protein
MADTRSKEEILQLIQAEMRGNLMVLIDPKKKNSFNDQRVNTWVNVTSERLYYYLIENKWQN